jgi:hypothetical protein
VAAVLGLLGLLCLPQLGLCAAAGADTGGGTGYETLAIPFPFYNESFGFGVGYVYGRSGWPEPQSRLLGTVMGGTAGSAMLLIAGQDLRTPWLERLFIDPFASAGYFGDTESYIDGNPDFPHEDAGTNDSSKKNFVRGDGFDNWLRVRLHYLLPLGHGRDQVVPRYELVDGLPVGGFTGARSLNPLASSRTFVDVRPFYRSQQIDGDDVSATVSTNGIDFGLTWDNRDFPTNPARGQSVSLALSRDFGAFNSSDTWTVWHAEVDQYFELHDLPRVRQTVVAFNAWTAQTPSWERRPDGSVANRPPAYAGATLGGLWRCAPTRPSASTTGPRSTTPQSCASSRSGTRSTPGRRSSAMPTSSGCSSCPSPSSAGWRRTGILARCIPPCSGAPALASEPGPAASSCASIRRSPKKARACR